MQYSAQDAYAKMAGEMLANPFAFWTGQWQRAGEEYMRAWWAEYFRLLAEATKPFVRPIPF